MRRVVKAFLVRGRLGVPCHKMPTWSGIATHAREKHEDADTHHNTAYHAKGNVGLIRGGLLPSDYDCHNVSQDVNI